MATALTQADLDKLEKAYVRGVRSVSYGNGNTVTFASGAEMLKAIQYAKAALAGEANKPVPSTYASFERC
jgi:hypothetical protein